MSTYLVTGATGFLGLHLCEALLSDGHKVRALVRSDAANLRDVGVETVTGDVMDTASVVAAAKGVDGVFHLAGKVSRDPEDGPLLHKLHVQGTQAVVDACKANKVKRLVHASTSGVVGVSLPPGEELDEHTQPDLTVVGKWPYYLSKIFAEQTAFTARNDGVEVVCINPSLLLGPGDVRGESTRDVRLFLERKIAGVPEGGISFVDVRDAARALVLGMEKGEPGERYLVGALNCTVREFLERLERVSGVSAPLLPMSRTIGAMSAQLLDSLAKTMDGTNPFDPISVEMASWCWYVNSEKAVNELGVSFRDPNETLLDTVEDLREQGVVSKGHLPAGAGLAESFLQDAVRFADRWRRKALERR